MFSAIDVNKMEHQMRHSQYEGRKREEKMELIQPHPEIATQA
jgi:2-oxo-4-hydroxy-4-carboxy--5-ureidoimidazoline (OHCU) decarboxylase